MINSRFNRTGIVIMLLIFAVADLFASGNIRNPHKRATAKITVKKEVSRNTVAKTGTVTKPQKVSGPAVVSGPTRVSPSSHYAVRVQIKPPLRRAEVIPLRPSLTAIWIPGYWVFNISLGYYVWINGYWDLHPLGTRWSPGYWSYINGYYYWNAGYWIY